MNDVPITNIHYSIKSDSNFEEQRKLEMFYTFRLCSNVDYYNFGISLSFNYIVLKWTEFSSKCRIENQLHLPALIVP